MRQKQPSPLTIRISEDMKKSVRKVAQSQGMSTNGFIVRVIQDGIRNTQQK
jgi:predicted HicB family RNase H-like nuclease